MSMFASSSSFMDPRERMRHAKLAMMQDEDEEDRVRKDTRRKSRRSDGEAGPSTPYASTAYSQSPTKPTTSILRRPSSSFLDVDFSPGHFAESSASGQSSRGASRRDSRVRFSDFNLPSAHSCPLSPARLPLRTDSISSSSSSSSRPAPPTLSDIHLQMASFLQPHSSALPLLPTSTRTRSARASSASQTGTGTSTSPHRLSLSPFDSPDSFNLSSSVLGISNRSSFASSTYSSSNSSSSSSSRSNRQAISIENDQSFTPQPLAYPKIPQALLRYSYSSTATGEQEGDDQADDDSQSELAYALGRLHTSSTYSFSSASSSVGHLEDTLATPGLPDLWTSQQDARRSFETTSSAGYFEQSHQQSSTSTSTSTSASTLTLHRSPSFADSQSSSSIFSDTHSSFSFSTDSTSELAFTAAQTLARAEVAGAAFKAAFGQRSEGKKVNMSINRQDYRDELGLSPRSGPSPVPDNVAMLCIQSIPALDNLEQGQNEPRRAAPTCSGTSRVSSRGHRRDESDSSLGVVANFPVPPSRTSSHAPEQQHECLEDTASLAAEDTLSSTSAYIPPTPELDAPLESSNSVESEKLNTPEDDSSTVVMPTAAYFDHVAVHEEEPEAFLTQPGIPPKDGGRRAAIGDSSDSPELAHLVRMHQSSIDNRVLDHHYSGSRFSTVSSNTSSAMSASTSNISSCSTSTSTTLSSELRTPQSSIRGDYSRSPSTDSLCSAVSNSDSVITETARQARPSKIRRMPLPTASASCWSMGPGDEYVQSSSSGLGINMGGRSPAVTASSIFSSTPRSSLSNRAISLTSNMSKSCRQSLLPEPRGKSPSGEDDSQAWGPPEVLFDGAEPGYMDETDTAASLAGFRSSLAFSPNPMSRRNRSSAVPIMVFDHLGVAASPPAGLDFDSDHESDLEVSGFSEQGWLKDEEYDGLAGSDPDPEPLGDGHQRDLGGRVETQSFERGLARDRNSSTTLAPAVAPASGLGLYIHPSGGLVAGVAAGVGGPAAGVARRSLLRMPSTGKFSIGAIRV